MLYEHNITAKVVDYLRDPLEKSTLRDLAKKLGMRPQDFLRKKETVFSQLNLDLADDEAVLQAMVEHPILIERPIIVFRDKAVIGRPPEKLGEFLKRVL